MRTVKTWVCKEVRERKNLHRSSSQQDKNHCRLKVFLNFAKLNYLFFKNYKKYSNTSQTCGSKLATFSNSGFLLLFFTSKLAVPLLSTQIRDFCYFLSPKNREFGGITVQIDPEFLNFILLTAKKILVFFFCMTL